MARTETERGDADRLVGQLVRVGRVSSVNADNHTAKVEFADDGDDQVSHDLAVLVTRPGDYSLPAAGSLVACILIPGASGDGFILGALYSDSDAPPTSDAGARVVAGDDVRLGGEGAVDKVALAPVVNDNFNAIKQHFQVVEQIITGPPINEAGNGAPSSFQAALAAAIAGAAYPTPDDVDAEKVSAL